MFISMNSNALYYRFWRGTIKPDLANDVFINSLNCKFIPQTVNVGVKHGLISYLPLIKKFECGQKCFSVTINEFALVVYKNEKTYLDYIKTQEGIDYQNLHFDYFDKAKSKSLVPQKLIKIEDDLLRDDDRAFEIISSESKWQSGNAYFYVTEKSKSLLEKIKKLKAKSYIILIDGGFVYHYILDPESKVDFEGIKFVYRFSSKDVKNLKLVDGEGINSKF